MKKKTKPATSGETSFVVESVRDLHHGGTPCAGYMRYEERPLPDKRILSQPDVFDIIQRALGDNPEFGSQVRLTVQVEVIVEGKPSRKKCHNPWPAHVHDNKRRRRSK
ncbi:MAG TPA: hypothetical protein VF183_07300 [Acidimicrobiales bacterium]